ncbi:MAG TPA: hypothetical protein VMI94_01920 [Bryobacteraceae bacterium]|nr:hypothetical protein [Bryobacteraceae bacterium]
MALAETEPLTTHISADVQKLYEDSFLGERTQTSTTSSGPQANPRTEFWRQLAPLPRRVGYDPAIIRFYEDVITELQRELARYKAMVAELSKPTAVEIEVEYSTGRQTVLPPALASRLRSSTAPPSPMIGHEI